MVGPTPVSALIHAATMVTVGVYLCLKLSNLFFLFPEINLAILIIASFTSIIAGIIAFFQYELKKILAFSTVSQLGLMMLAIGVNAYNASLFHVFTHAFFKACLFLSAASIIHYAENEQDIRKLGGLKDELKPVFWAMLLAGLAMAGFPFTSGFISKDLILLSAFEYHQFFGIVVFLSSFLTGLYTFKLIFWIFLGEKRSQIKHPHKPSVMMNTVIARNIKFWSKN